MEATSSWHIVVDPVTSERRRAWEAMMTLGDGAFGTRGLGSCCGSPAWPAVLAAGVYDDSPDPTLLEGPLWSTVELAPDDGWTEAARLDLRDAVLSCVYTHPESGAVVTCTKFASAARRGVMALRARGAGGALADSPVLRPPRRLCEVHAATGASVPTDPNAARKTGSTHVAEMQASCGTAWIGAVGRQWIDDRDGVRDMTRLAVYRTGDAAEIEMAEAQAALAAAASAGFDRLLDEHRDVWHRRWERARSDIGGDARLDTAIKFAEYHLLSSANEHDEEVAIGARGLTGSSYHGHVFWDTDVFVVPALAALSPRAARAALVYRWRRLGAAREQARRAGRSGARFPWESAADGRDVTPHEHTDLDGNVVPIRTGDLEEHIVADVAWAVVRYVDWTGDQRFMEHAGVVLLAETARYWASRLDLDADGSAHLRNVIGPDEYHVGVDDNAFTNVMARFNLRTAADHCAALGTVSSDEERHWRDLADRIVDGLDPVTGVYEQFAGFHRLAPTLVAGVGTPPLNASLALGRDVLARSQIIKQPDVLMLHHLVPAEVAPGSLQPNLDVYIPRTAHGSSLSPAICAGLLARAGQTAEAVGLFELAACLDLDPLTGATTMGGVHLAAMGGVWQAFTHGFLGLRLTPRGITLDPRFPSSWGTVGHRIVVRRTPVQIEVDSDRLRVTAPWEVEVGVGDCRDPVVAESHEFRRTSAGWERR